MANDLNLCQFIGRLGREPEQRFLANGDAVVNFSLAVGWKGKDKEGVEWVNVVAFKKLAEIIAKYCVKGQMIYVAGKMRTRKWQDREGQDRYSVEIVADQMQMLGRAGDSPAPQQERPAQSQPAAQSGGFDDQDAIPF